MTNSDFHRSADIVDPDFVESVEVQTEYEKGWAAGQVALQSLCDQACQLALADELEIAALKERVKELRMRLTGGAAQSAQVRAKTIEECASHLEQKADLLTNSLHCGDNSATIAAAHKKSRQLYEAAAIINELAFAAQPPAAPVETEQSLRPLKAVEPVEVGFATGPQCSAGTALLLGNLLDECISVEICTVEDGTKQHTRRYLSKEEIAVLANAVNHTCAEPQTVIGSATLRAAAQALVHEISESGTHTRWKRLANATENERTEPRTTVSETQFQAALRKICERTNDPVARSIAGEALEIAEQAQMGGTHD